MLRLSSNRIVTSTRPNISLLRLRTASFRLSCLPVLSDKISALTLVVQESPVHTTKSFESLLTLAKKKSRGQAVTALGALKDLLGVGVVLPADRRLRTFAAQPGLLGTLEEDAMSEWKSGQKLPGRITQGSPRVVGL